MKKIIFLCVFAIASTALANGGSAFKGTSEKLNKCYSRVYTPAHLASHPDQTIVKMAAKFSQEVSWYQGEKQVMPVLTIQAKAKGDSKVYGVTMPCYKDGNKTRCAIDCDGPNVQAYFSVNNPGGMLIDNRNGNLALDALTCGDEVSADEQEAYELILNNAKGADDIFLLYPWIEDDYKCL